MLHITTKRLDQPNALFLALVHYWGGTGPGHHHTHVELHNLLVVQCLGDVPLHDLQRDTLRNGDKGPLWMKGARTQQPKYCLPGSCLGLAVKMSQKSPPRRWMTLTPSVD